MRWEAFPVFLYSRIFYIELRGLFFSLECLVTFKGKVIQARGSKSVASMAMGCGFSMSSGVSSVASYILEICTFLFSFPIYWRSHFIFLMFIYLF